MVGIAISRYFLRALFTNEVSTFTSGCEAFTGVRYLTMKKCHYRATVAHASKLRDFTFSGRLHGVLQHYATTATSSTYALTYRLMRRLHVFLKTSVGTNLTIALCQRSNVQVSGR